MMLRHGLVLLAASMASIGATGTAFAQVATKDAPPSPSRPVDPSRACSSRDDRQHLLGLVLDVDNGHDAIGARYMNALRNSSGCGGLGAMLWLGYGAEAQVEGTSAMVTQAVGRAGMLGDAFGMGVELGGGVGTDFGRTIAAGSAALLFDAYFFGLGVSYQFPIASDRPAWLGAVQFALRVHIPLSTYDVREEHTTR
jgi:hypothetical protein